jgi:hypothetical protein
MKRILSPPEKKILSYAKDGRNTVAESRSKADKAITKRKEKANRALRRAESVVSAEAAQRPDDVDAFVARTGRKSWRKIPDSPLGEYVAARLRNRKRRGMNRSQETAPLLEKGRRISVKRPIALNGSTGNGSLQDAES